MDVRTLMAACPNLQVIHVADKPKTHEVIDAQTKAVIGQYTSLNRALAVADRKDADYGAVRYIVRPIL